MNGDGRPSFSSLQNFGDGAAAILFYAFDAPVVAGADLRNKPLATRREMLRDLISKLPDTIRFSETFDASASELMAAVRSNGLEGVVAKRLDSSYKPGDRSGAWVKVRANRGQEPVIGGYIPGSTNFDSILVGYYEGRDLMYAEFGTGSRQLRVGRYSRISRLCRSPSVHLRIFPNWEGADGAMG